MTAENTHTHTKKSLDIWPILHPAMMSPTEYGDIAGLPWVTLFITALMTITTLKQFLQVFVTPSNC